MHGKLSLWIPGHGRQEFSATITKAWRAGAYLNYHVTTESVTLGGKSIGHYSGRCSNREAGGLRMTWTGKRVK